MDGESSATYLLGLLLGQFYSQKTVVVYLHFDRSGHILGDIFCFLLSLSEEWIKKFRLPDILSQFPMLKKHMHCFPQRVVENFDYLLMDEGVLRDGFER